MVHNFHEGLVFMLVCEQGPFVKTKTINFASPVANKSCFYPALPQNIFHKIMSVGVPLMASQSKCCSTHAEADE